MSHSYNYIYIGLTRNIDRRVNEHNKGWVQKTKFYRPFHLVHVELVKNRHQARKVEKYLKSGFGREIVKEISKNK